MLLAQAERRLGIAAQLAWVIPDTRDADRVVHLLPDILRPTATTMTGSLAVAAITATALSLFHDLDATVMILIWNLGTPAILGGLGGLFGRRASAGILLFAVGWLLRKLVAPRCHLERR
jgi:hypothetical protein